MSAEVVGLLPMQRLMMSCNGDIEKAHALFAWNLRMSGAFYEALHLFELIVRNSMDRELRAWNLRETGDEQWLIHPNPYLKRVLHAPTMSKARSRAEEVAKNHGRNLRHDDVLAQLTLGTWRYLLPSRSSAAKRRIWTECLSAAFPLWSGPASSIVARVEAAHDLRNRVAHLEPVYRWPLRYVRKSMRDVCYATSVPNGRLFVQQDRLLPLIESFPLATASATK